MKLENKVAIITGSSSGIGYAVAESYIKNGASVMICGITEEETKSAVEKLKNTYPDAKVLGEKVDVTITSDVENVFKKTIEAFGKIDIVVNNAGIAPAKPIDMMSDEDFERVININLNGTFKGTREAVKYMKETGGSIINTSSFVSLYGGNTQSAYTASKAGVNGLTKSNAKELGKYGIRVNAIAPGVIMTDMVKETVSNEVIERMKMMTPLQRVAVPEDLTGLYVYLASDESLHTTGTIINVDGGLMM